MMGFTLNTHHQWIARQLLDLGYRIDRQVSVPDEGTAIRGAVSSAMEASDLVIVTGGLGPTSDDRTREEIADLLGMPLKYSDQVDQHIRDCFKRRKRPMPESVLIQAWAPDGSEILMNQNGTAPGLWIQKSSPGSAKIKHLVLLPGPPRELYPMFKDQVKPLIQNRLPIQNPLMLKQFHVVGLGESWIQEKLEQSPLRKWMDQGIDVGYCAGRGEVTVRLIQASANQEIDLEKASEIVRASLGRSIFSETDSTLEEEVVRLLREKQRSVTVAESCTGGYLAHRITNVPGSSDVFWGGFLVYSNIAKQNLVGVSSETLEKHGAVSEATARELAIGARKVAGTDYALSITGIAGPGGGSPDKPVGLVYIGLASSQGVEVIQRIHDYDRETFKLITTQYALDILRQVM